MNNIRQLITLVEHALKQYSYVGTCVDSFDEDSMDYLHNKLNDINDFSVIDEQWVNDEHHDPALISRLDGFVPKLEEDSIIVFVETRDMIIIYNPREDIHYFYE